MAQQISQYIGQGACNTRTYIVMTFLFIVRILRCCTRIGRLYNILLTGYRVCTWLLFTYIFLNFLYVRRKRKKKQCTARATTSISYYNVINYNIAVGGVVNCKTFSEAISSALDDDVYSGEWGVTFGNV